jgi:hypothetical protein
MQFHDCKFKLQLKLVLNKKAFLVSQLQDLAQIQRFSPERKKSNLFANGVQTKKSEKNER